MKKNKKDLPDGVPEENIYENTHILLYVFYAIAVASVVLLMVNQYKMTCPFVHQVKKGKI